MQRTAKLHNLDIKHQNASHQRELVVKDEEARRIETRNVLLRNDNASLQDCIGQKESRINQLTGQCQGLRLQLDSASEACREQEMQMRIQTRELSTLKVLPRPAVYMLNETVTDTE